MKCPRVALLFLGIVSTGALAQSDSMASQASTGPTGETAAAEDPPEGEIIVEGEVPEERRRVCETTTTTGSIMPKRVCRTVAQIEEDERTARESLEIIKRDRDSRAFTQMAREQGT